MEIKDILFIVFMAVLSVSSFACGYSGGKDTVHREAIKAGVAEWVGDKEGGPVFKWIQED